ncbi:MAG: transposase, partial [Patescibacteria group bacterium]
MPRNYTFAIGEYYHLYNRGNDRRVIFKDNRDRNRFIALLYLCNGRSNAVDMNLYFESGLKFFDLLNKDIGDPLVAVGAYCLMPNHFHLLVKQTTNNGISVFMKKIGTAYSMYFNKRHLRTGSLYEGSY